MEITRKQAKSKVKALYREVSRLPINPNNFVYIELYKAALELYAQEKYFQALNISNAILSGLREN